MPWYLFHFYIITTIGNKTVVNAAKNKEMNQQEPTTNSTGHLPATNLATHAEQAAQWLWCSTPGRCIIALCIILLIMARPEAVSAMCMVAILPVTLSPSAVPGGTTLSGRYYCRSARASAPLVVSLMYNSQTGNIIGLPANATRHSFGYYMGKNSVAGTRSGSFIWEPEIRNQHHFPAFAHAMFLLASGDFAVARISHTVAGRLTIVDEDIPGIVLLSKTGVFPDLYPVTREIQSMLQSWEPNHHFLH
jgi:hypothetical protein